MNIDALVIPIMSGMDFIYSIGRYWDPNEEEYTLYVNISVANYSEAISKAELITIMDNMNFNFSENSYIDTEAYEETGVYTFYISDIVYITVNGYTIDDWEADLIL